MKVAIVCRSENISLALKSILTHYDKDKSLEICIRNHQTIFSQSLYELDRILVCDYEEPPEKTDNDIGLETYNSLSEIAKLLKTKLFRIGAGKYDYPNYFRIPCNFERFVNKLKSAEI